MDIKNQQEKDIVFILETGEEEKRIDKIKAKRKWMKNAGECVAKVIMDKLNGQNGEC